MILITCQIITSCVILSCLVTSTQMEIIFQNMNTSQQGAFNLEDDDFEEAFGFSKPKESDTLVFTCKAGIRSQQAAQFAAMSGYKDLVNYMGGADDWFQDGPGW